MKQITLRHRLRATGVAILSLICVLTLIDIFSGGDANAQSLNRARGENRSPGTDFLDLKIPIRPISLLIEEGAVIPSQFLTVTDSFGNASLPDRRIVDSPIHMTDTDNGISQTNITFSLISGTAQFVETTYGTSSTVAADGLIYLPAIKSGIADDESLLRVSVSGRPAIRDIRVATLPKGGIANLLRYFQPGTPAMISFGEDFAVIDENKAVDVSKESVTDEFDIKGNKQNETTEFGLCIRSFWGPGKVKWGMSNPANYPYWYSIKPESSNSLRFPTAPDDSLDALYRWQWGCGTALKVPDSCTITVSSGGGISACCNAAAMALGHKIKWVYPRDHGFPHCPI
ncbi:MAG: hypothetical protein WBD22_04250 [Pyrinomonadaceae bacterium]